MSGLYRFFAQAEWLTAARARLYAGMLAVAMALFLLLIFAITAQHWNQKPQALDFDAYWAAAHLAAQGHPATAYNNAIIEATERAATIMAPGYLAFYYPPPFLLLLLPLGFLSYSMALLVFLVAEYSILLGLLRQILRPRWAWLPLLGWPALLMNGLSGQNAPLSASAFLAAALWLETRPLLAGACLGALACKPQLAVCVPIALLAARRCRVLIATGLSAIFYAALSWLALGTGTWQGFLANAGNARLDIETIAIKWPRMQSIFGAVRLLGFGNHAAYAAQSLISLAAVAGLIWIAKKRPGAGLEAAAMATAALLFTPFLYDYDLLILATPLACLTMLGQPNRFLPGEKFLLACLYLLPLLARPAGLMLGLTLGPPFIAATMLALLRRARA